MDEIRFGDFRLSTTSFKLWQNSTVVSPPLTSAEGTLLIYLIENRDRIVSREELLSVVASKRVVEDAILNQYIKTLRKVLGDSARSPKYIRTYQKQGYQFIGQVQSNNQVSFRIKFKYTAALLVFAISIIAGILLFNPFNNSTSPKNLATPLTSLKGHALYGTASSDKRFFLFSHKKAGDSEYWQLMMKLKDKESYYQLTEEPANHVHPEISPNGTQLLFQVYSNDVNEIRIANINWQTFQLENVRTAIKLPPKKITAYISWKDEDNFYYSSRRTNKTHLSISLRNIENNSEIKITNPSVPGAGDLAIAYSPNNETLAFFRNIGFSKTEVYTLNVNTNELTLQASIPMLPITLDWFSDSELILRETETQLSLLDINTSELRPIYDSTKPIYTPFYLPDNQIAFTHGAFIVSDIQVFSLSDEDERKNIISSSFNDIRPVLARDSGDIAFLSNRTGLYQIWIKAKDDTVNQLTQFEDSKQITHLSISPNGKYLAYTNDAKIYVLNTTDGSLKATIAGDQKSYIDPVFSNDNSHLLYTAKLGDGWYIEKLDLNEISVAAVLTEGYLPNPCYQDSCIYYLRLSDKKLLLQTKHGQTIETDINLPSVGYVTQYVIHDDAVYFTEENQGDFTLYRQNLNDLTKETIARLPTRHFQLDHANGAIIFANRRHQSNNIEKVDL